MQLSRFLLILSLAGPLALLGCDSDDGDDVTDDSSQTFTVNFQPLNGSGVSGTATLTLSDEDDLFSEDDDRFIVEINATGLGDVAHAQHIHALAQCPTMAGDANEDGFLDVVEGTPTYGGIIVPLDDDLLDSAANGFPTGTTIAYEASADFDAFFDVYDGEDDNEDDPFTTFGDAINLGGRTIVLHGVRADMELPETVASIGDLPATGTLPVACGTIQATN